MDPMDRTGSEKEGWSWWKSGAFLPLRPSWAYDTHLCTRVSAASRDLVNEIATAVANLEQATFDAENPKPSMPSRYTNIPSIHFEPIEDPSKIGPRFTPRPFPANSAKSHFAKEAARHNFNSFPRPQVVGPKVFLSPPKFIRSPATSKSSGKKQMAKPRKKVSARVLRKTTLPPRRAILNAENIRAVLETRCVHRMLEEYDEVEFNPPPPAISREAGMRFVGVETNVTVLEHSYADVVWSPCVVLKYDKNTRLFQIQWGDPDAVLTKANTKWVSRLNLCIPPMETPALFEKELHRVRHFLRVEEEAMIGYMTLDCLAREWAAPPMEHLMRNIARRGSPKRPSASTGVQHSIVRAVLEEAKQSYMQVNVIKWLQKQLEQMNQPGRETMRREFVCMLHRANVPLVSKHRHLLLTQNNITGTARVKDCKVTFSNARTHPRFTAPCIQFLHEFRKANCILLEEASRVVLVPTEDSSISLSAFSAKHTKTLTMFELYMHDVWQSRVTGLLHTLRGLWLTIIFPPLKRGQYPLSKKLVSIADTKQAAFFSMVWTVCKGVLDEVSDIILKTLMHIVIRPGTQAKECALYAYCDSGDVISHFDVCCEVSNNGRNQVIMLPKPESFTGYFETFIRNVERLVRSVNASIEGQFLSGGLESDRFETESNDIDDRERPLPPNSMDALNRITAYINASFADVINKASELRWHEDAIVGNNRIQAAVTKWQTQQPSIVAMVNALPRVLTKNLDVQHSVSREVPPYTIINPLFRLVLEPYKHTLKASYQLSSQTHAKAIMHRANVQVRAVYEQYADIVKYLDDPLEDALRVQVMVDFLQELPAKMDRLNEALVAPNYVYNALDSLSLLTNEVETFRLRWRTRAFPLTIANSVDVANKKVKLRAKILAKAIETGEIKFDTDCEEAAQAIIPLRDYTFEQMEEADVFCYNATRVADRLNACAQQAKLLTVHRRILGMPAKDYGSVVSGFIEAEHYASLWSLVAEIQRFYDNSMDGDVDSYDVEGSVKHMEKWFPRLHEISGVFASVPIPFHVAEHLKHRLMLLKRHEHVLQLLSADTLRSRHWERLRTVLEVRNSEEEDMYLEINNIPLPARPFVLRKVYSSGILLKHTGYIRACVLRSKKEFEIEKELLDMRNVWRELPLQFKSRKTQTAKMHAQYSLMNGREIIRLAGSQLANTNKLIASKYSAFQLDDLYFWRNYLRRAMDTMELWQTCIGLRSSVLPLFLSNGDEDNRSVHIPTAEATLFSLEDAWTNLIDDAMSARTAYNMLKGVNLNKSLDSVLQLLETLLRSVKTFLFQKRIAYPPFFFISDRNLVRILGLGLHSLKLVSLAVPGVRQLIERRIEDGGVIVEGVMTCSDEKIYFPHAVRASTCKTVEDFCVTIERNISESLVHSHKESFRNKHAKYRHHISHPRKCGNITERILQWLRDAKTPLQIRLLELRRLWCDLAKAAMANEDMQLSDVEETCSTLSHAVIFDIRRNVNNTQNTAIVSVLQILLQQTKTLRSLPGCTTNFFGWQVIPRVHYCSGTTEGEAVATVAIYSKEIAYLYQPVSYPADAIIVYSPVTERCIRAIVYMAWDNVIGPLVKGEPSCGKRYACRASAELCGAYLIEVAWNSLSTATLYHDILAGMVGSGYWVCIGGLERCMPHILAMMATDFFALRNQVEMDNFRNSVYLAGTDGIPYSRHSFILATARSVELACPTNLQTCFSKQVSVVHRPAWGPLAKLLLETLGYANSDAIGEMIGSIFCRFNLHFNVQLGFLELKSIISVVIRHVSTNGKNLPGGSHAIDRGIWHGAIAAVINGKLDNPKARLIMEEFSERHIFDEDLTRLHKTLEMNLLTRNSSCLQKKVKELFGALSIYNGVIICGPPMGGKSSVWKTLRDCIPEKVSTTVALPHTLSPNALYGGFGRLGQWEPGMIEVAFQKANQIPMHTNDGDVSKMGVMSTPSVLPSRPGSPSISPTLSRPNSPLPSRPSSPINTESKSSWFQQREQWLVFDGEIDEAMMNMLSSTALPTEKHKGMQWGSRDVVTVSRFGAVRCIFESLSLDHASPAMLEKCALIHIPQKGLFDWKSVAKLYLQETIKIEVTRGFVWLLLDRLIPDILGLFLSMTTTEESILVHQFLRLLNALLPLEMKETTKTKKQTPRARSRWKQAANKTVQRISHQRRRALHKELGDVKEMGNMIGSIGGEHRSAITAYVVISLEWTFGTWDRTCGFSSKFLNILSSALPAIRMALPEGKTVRECFYDKTTKRWVQWKAVHLCNSWKNEVGVIPKYPRFSGIQKQQEWLLVPTPNVLGPAWVLQHIIMAREHAYVYGGSSVRGVGKTSTWRLALSTSSLQSHSAVIFASNSVSSAQNFENKVRQHLTERENGVLGPFEGAYLNIIVDDVHIPNSTSLSNTQGTGTFVEAIRGRLERHAWYSLAHRQFKEIQGTACVLSGRSSSQLPGAKRDWARCRRHFIEVDVVPMSTAEITAVLCANRATAQNGIGMALQNTIQNFAAMSARAYNLLSVEDHRSPLHVSLAHLQQFWQRFVALGSAVTERTDLTSCWWQEFHDVMHGNMGRHFDTTAVIEANIASKDPLLDTTNLNVNCRIWRNPELACLEMISLNEDLSHLFGSTTTITEEFTCAMDEDAPSVLLDHISEDEEDDGPNETVEPSELEIEKEIDDDTLQQEAVTSKKKKSKGKKKSKSPKKKSDKGKKKRGSSKSKSPSGRGRKGQSGRSRKKSKSPAFDKESVAEIPIDLHISMSSTFWETAGTLLKRFRLPVLKCNSLIEIILRLARTLNMTNGPTLTSLIAPDGYKAVDFVDIASRLAGVSKTIKLLDVNDQHCTQVFFEECESLMGQKCAVYVDISLKDSRTYEFLDGLSDFLAFCTLETLRDVCGEKVGIAAHNQRQSQRHIPKVSARCGQLHFVLHLSSDQEWAELCKHHFPLFSHKGNVVHLQNAWDQPTVAAEVALSQWDGVMETLFGKPDAKTKKERLQAKKLCREETETIINVSAMTQNYMRATVERYTEQPWQLASPPIHYTELLIIATTRAEDEHASLTKHIAAFSRALKAGTALSTANKSVGKLLKRQTKEFKTLQKAIDKAQANLESAMRNITAYFVDTNKDAAEADMILQSLLANIARLELAASDADDLASSVAAQLTSSHESIAEALKDLKLDKTAPVPTATILHLLCFLLGEQNRALMSKRSITIPQRWPQSVTQAMQPDFVPSIVAYLTVDGAKHMDREDQVEPVLAPVAAGEVSVDEEEDVVSQDEGDVEVAPGDDVAEGAEVDASETDDDGSGVEDTKETASDEEVVPVAGTVSPETIRAMRDQFDDFFVQWERAFHDNKAVDAKGNLFPQWVELLFEALLCVIKRHESKRNLKELQTDADIARTRLTGIVEHLMETDTSCTEMLDVVTVCEEQLIAVSNEASSMEVMVRGTQLVKSRGKALLRMANVHETLWKRRKKLAIARRNSLPITCLLTAVLQSSLGVFRERPASRLPVINLVSPKAFEKECESFMKNLYLRRNTKAAASDLASQGLSFSGGVAQDIEKEAHEMERAERVLLDVLSLFSKSDTVMLLTNDDVLHRCVEAHGALKKCQSKLKSTGGLSKSTANSPSSFVAEELSRLIEWREEVAVVIARDDATNETTCREPQYGDIIAGIIEALLPGDNTPNTSNMSDDL